MQGFESDATYCSQAEKVKTQSTMHTGKADRSLFRNVRRSQRLLQQTTKTKSHLNWANIRYQMTQSPTCARKRRKRRSSQSSAHFHQSIENDVCSKPTDLSKATTPVLQNCAEILDLKSVKIKQSIDLMAELETDKFTDSIPLNQEHLLDTMAHTSNQTPKDDPKIDLTQSSSKVVLKKHTRTRSRKKDANVIDLTKDGGKRAAAEGFIRRHRGKTKARETLCDIQPKIAKIDKFGLSSPTPSAFLMSNEDMQTKDNRYNNKQTNFDKQDESWKQLDTVPVPLSTADNSLQRKTKVERGSYDLEQSKSKVHQSIKEKQAKYKRKMSDPARTKTKLKHDMITRYLNLADFVEDNEAEKRKKKFQLHPSCPTSTGSYEPPTFPPTKPVPLLRSVAKSVLPKVYPPHFIHQKPPIEFSHSIPYEQTHVREMEAFRRTRRPNPLQQSTMDTIPENKPRTSMNYTPTSMLYPAASPIPTKIHATRVTSPSITPERRCVTNYLTPELSQPLDGQVTTSTSPSLPESLKGVFDSDDLRQILNVDKIEYKLCDNHVKALAIVLNIRVENLREVLKNIVKLDQEVLRKIESAMKMTTKETTNENDKQDAGCFVRNLMSPASEGENNRNTNATPNSFPNRRYRT